MGENVISFNIVTRLTPGFDTQAGMVAKAEVTGHCAVIGGGLVDSRKNVLDVEGVTVPVWNGVHFTADTFLSFDLIL